MDFFRGYRNFHGILKGLHIASWILQGIDIYIFSTIPMEFLRSRGMDFLRGYRNFHGFLKGLHIASWISSGHRYIYIYYNSYGILKGPWHGFL